MIKAHSVKNRITLVKLDFPFATSGHRTWELKVHEHSLGGDKVAGLALQAGRGRVHAHKAAMQTSSNQKLRGSSAAAVQWGPACMRRESRLASSIVLVTSA